MAQSNAGGSIHWGITLATLSIITIAAGAIVWGFREPPPEIELIHAAPTGRTIPPPNVVLVEADANPELHAVTEAIENGTRVVRIKVVAGGDELIVDADTGRLLETRPGRPATPGPAGKFTAPHDPMM